MPPDLDLERGLRFKLLMLPPPPPPTTVTGIPCPPDDDGAEAIIRVLLSPRNEDEGLPPPKT